MNTEDRTDRKEHACNLALLQKNYQHFGKIVEKSINLKNCVIIHIANFNYNKIT